MENTLKIGRIYHVIDKTTGEVVKVGSTISTLRRRWGGYDKVKYPNHFLREVRQIESSDLDWYEPKNPESQFLWHLVAIEHLEIFKQNTFRISKISNRHSPLFQKANGFDVSAQLEDIGRLAGAARIKMPDWAEVSARGRATAWKNNKTNPVIAELGKEQGRKNAKNGHMAAIQKLGCSKAGKISAVKKHALKDSEGKSIAAVKMGRIGGIKGGVAASHLRWHVNRNIVSPVCPLCSSL